MKNVKTRHYLASPDIANRAERELTSDDEKDLGYMAPFSLELSPSRPEKPSLVSSSEGELDLVLLTIPSYAVNYSSYSNVYTDLIYKLPSETSLVVLTHDSVKSDVENWLSIAGRSQSSTVIATDDHLYFSVWAEDAYTITNDLDNNNTYFVEPYSFPRYGDALIADLVSNATELKSTQAPLYFQGGNVLIGDEFFFIGIDYPKNSLQYINDAISVPTGEQPERFIKQLYNEYLDHDRDLHYIGSTIPVPEQEFVLHEQGAQSWVEFAYFGNKKNTRQPLFHIDMFLTFAGKNGSGKFQVLVGDPGLASSTLGAPESPYSMQRVFDNIAAQLTVKDFEVIRNPLPIAYVDDANQDAWSKAKFKRYANARYKGALEVYEFMNDSGIASLPVRTYYFATANNALVENSANRKQVWLPSYGHGAWPELSATDLENKSIWEQLGFSVHMLGDFHPFAQNLGAVHCISKYLRRS